MNPMEAATTATGTETQADPGEGGSEAAATAEPPAQETPETGAGETSDERDESGRYLSREAASYRRRLRETETERDQLRTQLDRLQTAEVERLAGNAGLQVPTDVWTFGAELDHLRLEDGSIDHDTVNELAASILKDRPGLQARPTGDLGIGRGAAAAGTHTEQKVGLSQLLKPEGR
jgi:hypothetical protein